MATTKEACTVEAGCDLGEVIAVEAKEGEAGEECSRWRRIPWMLARGTMAMEARAVEAREGRTVEEAQQRGQSQ